MVVPSPPFPSLDKAALRAAMREARREFVAHTDAKHRSELEEQLAGQLEPLLASASVIGGYCPVASEISPLAALERASADGATMPFPPSSIAPRLFFRVGEPAALAPGESPNRRSSRETVPEIVLVPMLAIDACGTRIGQGKGHYDRVLGPLVARGTRLIGVGWAFQRLEIAITADEWDIPLHGFASPQGLEIFGQ